jgi:hypothetical protein
MTETYTELPLGLPQSLDGPLVWVDGVEFVSKNPGRHFEREIKVVYVCMTGEYCSSKRKKIQSR